MKLRYFILPIALIFVSVSVILAESGEHLKGQDWLKITEQRKIYYIFAKRESAEYADVVFTHSASDYIKLLDQALAGKSNLRDLDMDQVFRTVVYENEAGSKEALSKDASKVE